MICPVGILFAAVIRRTAPAMAATLGVFVLVRFAASIWIRPHLLAATHAIVSLSRQGPVQLGIGSSNGGAVQVFAQGAQMTAFVHQHCFDFLQSAAAPPGSGPVGTADPGAACLDQITRTFKLSIAYQPADRYWTFQWLEAALFLGLATSAIGATYWWITRKAR